MIDFVCVSNDPSKSAELERSIRAALPLDAGEAWKLTVVDGTRHDVFSGYNAGAAQSAAADGEVLIFLHHDVLLLGNTVSLERPLKLLQEETTGIIGVAGATRLNAQGTWWGDLPQPQMLSFCRGGVGFPDGNPFGMNFFAWPGGAAVFGQVLVVDGVFLMCRRKTFDRLGGFDDKTFEGFHFYDVDISLRAHFAGLKNYVAPIPVFHASKGNYDQVWEGARQVFLRKWAGRLPVQI